MNTEIASDVLNESGQSKWSSLVEILKHQIMANKWEAGSRLPSYGVLEKKFNVSRVTMQQAIGRLKQDGFITSLERQGLFVSEELPHLNRFGIVLTSHERDNFFLRGLLDAADMVAEKTGREFVVYRNIGSKFCTQDSVVNLKYDIQAKRLAGMLFTFSVQKECHEPFIYLENQLPKVVLNNDQLSNSFRIRFNTLSMVRKGLDYLESQGCRRIAFLCQWENPPSLGYFRDEIQKRGLISPIEWQLPIQNHSLAEQISRLLLSLPENQRPEGIFIGDDNLTEPAIKGIVASGVKVPEELKVVSHCNWISELPKTIPIKYLGFDLVWIIENFVKIIDNFHRQQPQENEIELKPLFENELIDKR
jgi:DNA-binding LacI/PurR family transcriptional regulator